MSDIIVELEVLPGDDVAPQGDASSPSANEIFSEIQHQLADPSSPLRRGFFSWFTERASLSGQPAGGDLALSARIERNLSRTAAGANPSGPSSTEIDELQRFCNQLKQRLESAERELQNARDPNRALQAKVDLELKLKDREQLLTHAKEMWMKESIRASKLADALTSAEDKLADHRRELGDVSERYRETQKEVSQLHHLIESPVSPKARVASQTLSETHLPRKPLEREAVMISRSADINGRSAHGHAGLLSDSVASKPESSLGASALELCPAFRNTDLIVPDGNTSLLTSQAATGVVTYTERFKRLCHVDDAVLYEDDFLQIGVQAEYRGNEGRVGVYFGNKTCAALQALNVQYYVREGAAFRLSAEQLRQQIEAGDQVVQRVSLVCEKTFREPPWMRVQFLLPDASPWRIQLKFPVLLTKFMLGRQLSAQDFFQFWRQQHFVLNEVTQVVPLAEHLQNATLVQVARIVLFGGALRLHHGVDESPDNLVLVGQLALPNVAGGAGLVLVRVEVGAGRFKGKARISVRTGDSTTAQGLCDGIAAQLIESSLPPQATGSSR